MLNVLNELKCVKGTTGEAFISNERIKKGIRTGEIMAFNDEASITPERLLSKHISLVMYSGFGKEFPNDAKLQKLGIFPMANYDWREEHPLGKAEWVKLFGYLTGTEKKATAYFEELKNTYFTLTKELKSVGERPKILVGSLIGDIWYAPAGESYMAHLLKDAGTDYIYDKEKGTGSCEKSLEQVFKDQQQVKIWINAGAVSLNELQQQQGRYSLFDAFQSGKVYCYTHNSSYFWEMAAIHPDWLLSDFAMIAGNKKTHKLHFYQRLK
jgi:iron complex transport system substrate-binding protein